MGIFTQHWGSLPRWHDQAGRTGPLLPFFVFLVVPAAMAGGLSAIGLTTSAGAVGGLLAGIGVLGGLLFQVLAWVAGRVGAIADGIGNRAPSPAELATIKRLDIARANVAYAALVSILLTVLLGVVVMLEDPPGALGALSLFLLFHLGLTLVLVVVRINRIGQSDRVNALTAHAR